MTDCKLTLGDCLEVLPTLQQRSVDLAFCDPPYNIGICYGDGKKADSLPDAEYLRWVRKWIAHCVVALADTGSMWVVINDEYAAEYVVIMKGFGLFMRNWVIWVETFGVNCALKFNRTKRHLLYFCKHKSKRTFNRSAVNRPSDRQVKYKDARANPLGKNLDDCWQDCPRVCGTFKERIPEFPTQLPIKLLERIVGVSSDPGDLVVDPFSGSGTTGAACVRLGRNFLGIEKSKKFHDLSLDRLGLEMMKKNGT